MCVCVRVVCGCVSFPRELKLIKCEGFGQLCFLLFEVRGGEGEILPEIERVQGKD